MNPLALLSLLKNPWVLVAIVGVLGIGGTGWYRMQWLSVVAGQERAISQAQKKADELANELVILQAAAMAANEKVHTVYRDKVVNAPLTNTCGPVVRDALRGVHELAGSR